MSMISGSNLRRFDRPACGNEIRGVVGRDPDVSEPAGFSVDLHMLAKVRPIDLKRQVQPDFPLQQGEQGKRRMDLDIHNVLSGNDKGLWDDPASQLDAVRKDTVLLPEVLG